ncbi:MAG: hypothetical protein AAF513_02450 [Pseudomonadota bacterium]
MTIAGVALRRWLLGLGLTLSLAATHAVADDEYARQWAPPVGTPMPAFSAPDQNNQPQTFESISGEHGLLLILNRSADW